MVKRLNFWPKIGFPKFAVNITLVSYGYIATDDVVSGVSPGRLIF
jgi:hypothetical protein